MKDSRSSRIAIRSWCCRSVLFCLLLAGACSRDLPPTLIVVDRLLPLDDRAGAGQRSACAVGNEIRPARGCPEPVRLHFLHSASDDSRRYHVDPNGRGRALLIEKNSRPDVTSDWKTLEWQLIERPRSKIDLTFDTQDEFVAVRAFALSPVAQRLGSRRVRIRPGMVLQGGIALDPVVPAGRSAAVEFQIFARTTDGNKSLIYHQALAPGAPSPHWVDYTLDLGTFVDKEVKFEFITAFARRPPKAGVLAAPLWSLPLVLEPVETSGWNFIVVSIDTLRADHVGAYGADGEATPVLDEIAASGITFERATTTFPSTTASHMSLFTGLYPRVHEVFAPPFALGREVPTLAELLSAAGYRTAAVTENGMIMAVAGFQRGFDSYVQFREGGPTSTSGQIERVLDTGIDWLEENRSERFFLFLHSYQVHAPHEPPAGFDRFSAAADRVDTLERERAAYRGEILYTDHELGRLQAAIDALDLEDRTVLVVTSDHGEGFGEYGVVGHGHDLIQELMHIPLIVRAPGLTPPGARVTHPVSLVDIAPTLLELAATELPPGMQGRSLVGMMKGKDGSVPPPVFGEAIGADGEHLLVAWEGERKWHLLPGAHSSQRVDVFREEGWEGQPFPRDALRKDSQKRERLLEGFEKSARASRTQLGLGRPAVIEVDEETKKQLRALGYIP